MLRNINFFYDCHNLFLNIFLRCEIFFINLNIFDCNKVHTKKKVNEKKIFRVFHAAAKEGEERIPQGEQLNHT